MVHGLIDTHAHLYLDQFDNDIADVIERAKNSGVEKILLPNIDSGTIANLHKICDRYSELCRPMMGLHPTSVRENYKNELKIIGDCLESKDYIAVGEAGIDLYWDKSFFAEQQDAFRTQIKWAREKKLPLVIHARDSFDQIFEILDQEDTTNLTGVFHSFTGNRTQVKKILSYDFYLGINGIVTFKNSDLSKIVAEIPTNRILLETDSPFLAPTPYRGKKNESSFVKYVALKLGEIYQISFEEICEITSNNAKQLFYKAF